MLQNKDLSNSEDVQAASILDLILIASYDQEANFSTIGLIARDFFVAMEGLLYSFSMQLYQLSH